MVTKLVLIRHGQSIWNMKNLFTGWTDVPLTDEGRLEARKGAELLKKEKITFDNAFTSDLLRAQETLGIVLFVLDQVMPVTKDKALNERHYGDLQGLNKAEMAEKHGKEQVHVWRRSYDVPPPGSPPGESLKDTRARTLPYYKEKIEPLLKKGKNILISAHGNSLRSIVMFLENISEKDIPNLNIATGVPIIYSIDEKGKVIEKKILEFN